MSFFQLLLTSVVFNVTANILLKKGVLAIGGISGQKAKLISELTKAALSPFIIFGLILYGFSFIIWLRVLTFNDLSRAYPIFATIVFMLTTLGSIIFLKENVSVFRILGMIIMLVGIYIVARF
jgi:multidrug transporter EmrE-like cation transporter